MNVDPETYWDSVAGKKSFTIAFRPELLETALQPDTRILDYGCGYGRTLEELSALNCRELYGFDISGAMLELARQRIPRGHFNRDTTVWPDGFFDVVILLAVLTAVPEDIAQRQIVAEISRLLKPGGLLYVGDFLLNTDERNLKRYREAAAAGHPYGVFTADHDTARLRHHDPDYIRQLLTGFTPVCEERTIHRTMNGHTSNGFILIGRK